MFLGVKEQVGKMSIKYLVSLYFDDGTNRQIMKHMKAVAEVSGNHYMLEHNVPPHITVSSFEAEDAEPIIEMLGNCMTGRMKVELQWIGTGAFQSSVLYLTPVLNEYLQELMQEVYNCINEVEGVVVSKYYRPFQWLPHTTIGKRMNEEELIKGFAAVQRRFRIIKGDVVYIGLATASPYKEIASWYFSV